MIAKKENKDLVVNIIIGLFILITYTFGLLVPITSDAGKYAAISRIIYESGDWINLKIHFEPYLQKPPLLFWITTPFYFLFGQTVFAFKLPVLLFSGIAIYSTYRFSKIYYSKQTAILAALMLATSEFYFLFHNDIHTDSLLTANVIFSVWQLATYLKSKKLLPLILASAGIGLAIISKGSIGIFVPVTATLIHLIFQKKLKLLFSYKIVIGILVVAAILVVGLMGIYNQFGWEGIRFIFWDNNVGRISGKIRGSSTDYFFYFHTALYIFLPWGLLFFVALFFEFREQFKRKWKILETEELFSLGGITLYWIVISVARAKAPHYFMVISPFMAILSAKWIIRFFKDASFLKMKKTVTIIQYVIISGTWILFFTLCIFWFPAKSILFWSAITILIGLLFIPNKKNQLALIIRRSVITIIAINFALNTHIFPQLFTYQSTIPACTIFNEQAAKGEMLNTYLSEHRELFFYAKNPGHFLYDSNDLQKRLSYSGDWIYTNDEGLEEIKKLGTKIKVVKSFKHRSISKLSGKFMNPATREQSLKNMHLIKIE